MAEFKNDLFSVSYPVGWLVLEHEDGSGMILASSESSLGRYRQGAAFEPGDQVLSISLTPAELFEPLSIQIKPGASAEELSEAILSKLRGANGTETSPAEILALDGGREVALQRGVNDGLEGAVALIEIAEGIIAMSTILGHPGEYEAARATALAILSSLNFGGTAESLTAAIDPDPPYDIFAH